MEAAGRDLDEALVETGVGSLAVGHPLVLPRLVGLPVQAPVKKTDSDRGVVSHYP